MRALERTVSVPVEEADPMQLDLGVSTRGLFVSWIARGTVHVLSVAEPTEQVTMPAGWTASGPTAFGHDDRCATAWVTGNGKAVRMIASCP